MARPRPDRDHVAQVSSTRALVHVVDQDVAVEVVLQRRAGGGRRREVGVSRQGGIVRVKDLHRVQRDVLGGVAVVDVVEQLEARLAVKCRWRRWWRSSGGVRARTLRDLTHLDGVCPRPRLRVELGNVTTALRLRTRVVALLGGTSLEADEGVEGARPGRAEGGVRVAKVTDERALGGCLVYLGCGLVRNLYIDRTAIRYDCMPRHRHDCGNDEGAHEYQ